MKKATKLLGPGIQGVIAACILTPIALLAHAEPPSVLVNVATVNQQEVKKHLTAYGTLEPDPDSEFSLSLPRAGLINRVWVRLGQRVKSGDQLLELVTSPDARTQYFQAKSAVDFAKRELERQKRLLNEQMATGAEVDAARKNLQDALSTFEAVKKRGQGLSREVLRAPVDGIVTSLSATQGQRVAADTTVMLIGAQQRLIVRLGVEPEDLPEVRAGNPVIVKSVFSPDTQITTEVREVHAMIDPVTRLVEVLAVVPKAQSDQLVLGSRVSAQIQVLSRQSLVVPRSAVLFDAGKAYVFIIKAGHAKRVAVEAGADEGKMIGVRGDLQTGDKVVIKGNYELTDGASVRLAERH
ncbi:efflux RND transporter periplasmic adaptor subunit [Microbulbifer sp. SAOS-129_SWC]|uniref:efflux RND transporter periplasmic adaptor subunit n=1 Tax=Microbulbifer sp. SAOS-129_SWC TaxID=3145235 RepID=UPI003217702B